MVEQVSARVTNSADPRLIQAIAEAAELAGGVLPFDRYMELALYHPQLGYYARDRRRVGRDGDFITSVSIGRCFGLLLARRLAPMIERMARRPGELVLLEVGPEDGKLAGDMLAELEACLQPEVFSRLRYLALDPLSSVAGSAIGDWSQLSGARGVVIANEVLDAMPLKRLRFLDGAWWELGVRPHGDGFTDELLPIDSDQLREEVNALPKELENGFTLELNLRLRPWFAGMAAAFEEMYGCLIDYGHESEAFFDPARAAGTLRAYALHKPVSDPIAAPGECDLTAHVDFGRAGRAASAAGLEVQPLQDQHHFLIEAGREWLMEIEAAGVPDEGTAKLLRQFQSLTHPGAMGAAFKVMQVTTPGYFSSRR